MSLVQDAEIGHENFPTLRDFRPAGAPAPQWISAFCGAGAPTGEKTTDHHFPRTEVFT